LRFQSPWRSIMSSLLRLQTMMCFWGCAHERCGRCCNSRTPQEP
jgi:hypothetical protein